MSDKKTVSLTARISAHADSDSELADETLSLLRDLIETADKHDLNLGQYVTAVSMFLTSSLATDYSDIPNDGDVEKGKKFLTDIAEKVRSIMLKQIERMEVTATPINFMSRTIQ